jgi:hypothetical protein
LRESRVSLVREASLLLQPDPSYPKRYKHLIYILYKRFLNEVDSLINPLQELDMVYGLSSDSLEGVDANNEVLMAAKVLSIFGWEANLVEGNTFIKCNTCNRTAGAWQFTPVLTKQNGMKKLSVPIGIL